MTQVYPFYRVAWKVDGYPLRMKFCETYSEAKRHADEMVEELSKGSKVTALTPEQANDALAALEVLHGFYKSGGKRYSLQVPPPS